MKESEKKMVPLDEATENLRVVTRSTYAIHDIANNMSTLFDKILNSCQDGGRCFGVELAMLGRKIEQMQHALGMMEQIMIPSLISDLETKAGKPDVTAEDSQDGTTNKEFEEILGKIKEFRESIPSIRGWHEYSPYPDEYARAWHLDIGDVTEFLDELEAIVGKCTRCIKANESETENADP